MGLAFGFGVGVGVWVWVWVGVRVGRLLQRGELPLRLLVRRGGLLRLGARLGLDLLLLDLGLGRLAQDVQRRRARLRRGWG